MKKIILILLLLFCFRDARPQIISPVTWSYASKRISQGEAIVYLKADLKEGWHIYSAYQKKGGPAKTEVTFSPSKDYTVIGKVSEPKPTTKFDKNFVMDIAFFENSVIFQQKIKLNGKKAVVSGKIEFMACDPKQCLPPSDVKFNIPIP